MDKAAHVGTGGPTPECARGAFDTTQWSLVKRAGQADSKDGAAALEELCRAYWYPVYCFARRRSVSREDAEDLTQGFFADLLGRHLCGRAVSTRGHFRSFLLGCFRNYCAHQRDRAGARKRGGGCAIVSFDALESRDDGHPDEPADEETAALAYDRSWASCVIDRATADVRRGYVRIGRTALFDALEGVIRGEGEAAGYAAIADRLGLTPGGVKLAAFRLRRRLAVAVRADIAHTVGDPAQVEDEVRHLLAAWSG